MKHLASLMILATMIVLPTIMASTRVSLLQASSSPNIYVSPASKLATIDQEFTIDIDVDYVSNLYGYEIWMNFDNSKLNASAIDYDGFLNEITTIWHQEVNNTGGYVSLAVTSLRPAPAKTGGSPPPLATVHFKAIGLGTSTLHLNKTLLADDHAITITHTTADGEVICSAGTGHDVAVTNVTSYKKIIFRGYTSYFNVTVENHGGFPETFDVSLNASNVKVLTQTINNMSNGTSAIITYNWSTTGFALGNYTMSAYALPVPGETNTADNTFTDGVVTVSIVGDITGGTPSLVDFVPDGKVDMKDVAVVARFFSQNAPPGPPNSDVTGPIAGVPDGKIDMRDVGTVARHFGEHAP